MTFNENDKTGQRELSAIKGTGITIFFIELSVIFIIIALSACLHFAVNNVWVIYIKYYLK